MKNSELVLQLESLGYYCYVDPAQLNEVRALALKSGYVFGSETRREFPADAEELPSDGVTDFLRDIEPFLRAQGVTLQIEDTDCDGAEYFVRVNGRRFPIYTREENELTKRGIQPPEGDVWLLSTRRTMELVNWLLEDAGSPERMYISGGWNDQRAIFLTPEMHRLIEKSGVVADEDVPCSVEDLT